MAHTSLFDERKAAQAAAFLLHKAGGTLPVLKLMKLLYLAERLSLQRYGEPLTGDRLVAMPHGPVLSMTYDHIQGAYEPSEGGWDDWISDRAGHDVALRDAARVRDPHHDLLRLSETDLEVLGDVWSEFGHWTPWRLRDYTHSSACPEWTDPQGSSAAIEYETLFRAFGLQADEATELAHRITQQQRVEALFRSAS